MWTRQVRLMCAVARCSPAGNVRCDDGRRRSMMEERVSSGARPAQSLGDGQLRAGSSGVGGARGEAGGQSMPRRGQSGAIRAGPSERGHQSGAIRAY